MSHRLLGKGGSWVCEEGRDFTCRFRNLCQCSRGSHCSELDHIMLKKRTRSDLEECQHLGADRRIGVVEQVLEWAVLEAEGEPWKGRVVDIKWGEHFRKELVPSAREDWRETPGFCRRVRMDKKRGSGKGHLTGPLQIQHQWEGKWKVPGVNQVREWLWNMQVLAFCKQKGPCRNKVVRAIGKIDKI